MGDNYAIIRCRNAGVHAGIVESYSGQTVLVRESRRLWKWNSAFTLSELAEYGVGDPGRCRFAVARSRLVVLTEACEIQFCTPEAERSIREQPNG